MPLSLLDYHSLEDGELNRLWYEENDPRARDAFRTRWWVGGDPIAGKDLLSEYHNLFMHRCFERGLLAEEYQLKAFRNAVALFVAEFPAEPILKLEETLAPFIDRAIDQAQREIPPPVERTAAEEKALLGEALKKHAAAGDLLLAWAGQGTVPADEATATAMLRAAQDVLTRLDGATVAGHHPLVRTAEPPPSRLDESVAVPHFHAQPLFLYAAQGGTLSKRENDHIEWCQPCRQRCVGALLLLRRMRRALGGEVPPLPPVAPEFDQILQEENPGIPVIDDSKGVADPRSSGARSILIVLAVICALIAIAVVASRFRS